MSFLLKLALSGKPKKMSLAATVKSFAPAPGSFVLQNWEGFLIRVWHYLNDPFHIGSIELSVTRLIEGVLIFAIALLLSRTLTRLMERRIAKKAYVDAGLRYTMGRLFQYLVITLGTLLALKSAFNLDLTSIAVVFTALS